MAGWMKVTGWPLPENAVCAGHDENGQLLYVGRSQVGNELAPGKLTQSGLYLPFNGAELRTGNYEVLVAHHGGNWGSVTWVPVVKDKIPPRAIEGGTTEKGLKFYIGRVNHEGAVIPGKIHPKYKVVYFTHQGKELSSKKYEVLISA